VVEVANRQPRIKALSNKKGTSRRLEAVRIRLLGGFFVSVGSRTIQEGVWRLRKAAALVKLLALAPGHRLHRGVNPEAYFAFGLDLLLAGIEAMAVRKR